MDKQARIDLIEEARILGMKTITIEGVTYEFGEAPKVPQDVPEMKAEDILKPLSTLDEMSNEEILYWSTEYYDEIQARKEAMKKHAQEHGERQ